MLDNEAFIEEIQKKPILWKASDRNHKNKRLVMKFWEDMQRTAFPDVSVDDLKKRWKNLKDQYRKEIKRIPQSSPGVPLANVSSQWRYFGALSFLRDELGPLIGSSQSQDSNSNQEYQEDPLQGTAKTETYETDVNYESQYTNYEQFEQMSTKSDEDYEVQKESYKKRPLPNPNKIREEMIEIERKKLKLIEDEVKRNTLEKTDNYHFLMSLLPELEKLPTLQKMRFRSKVTTAMIEELASLQEARSAGLSGHNSLGINHSIDIKIEPHASYDE